jgi:hypothetical protein
MPLSRRSSPINTSDRIRETGPLEAIADDLAALGVDYKDGEPEHIAATGRLFRRTCVDFRDAL